MGAENTFIPHIMTLILLFLIASCSGIILKKIKFPYTIGLVVVGIVFAIVIENVQALKIAEDISLSHDIILYILLPTLIFEASVNIDSRLLLKNLLPVCALAIPGLVISTLIVGFCVSAFTPLHLGVAMLFGALISATDPVAVIALFKEVGAPKRLTMLVDGESLFNDATAIVAFNIVMAILVSGVALNLKTLGSASLSFLFVFVGGLLAGVIIGFIITRLLELSKGEPLIQVALSTVTAYTAFIVADHYLEVSGVMSTLGAGLVISWYGSTKFSHEVKEYMEQFWEFASFAANSFIFLLLGVTEWRLLIGHGHSPNFLVYLGIVILIVTFARFVVVYGLIPTLKYFAKYEKINLKYQTVIFWGGLRGAVPLALVLSLNKNFESQKMITEFTLGIVLFTLLVQGTTTKPLMTLFKLNKKSIFDKIIYLRGRLEAINKAKQIIMKLSGQSYLQKKVLFDTKKHYDNIGIEVQKQLAEIQKSNDFNLETCRKLLWYQVIAMEQKAYTLLFEKGLISAPVIRELMLNIELEQDKVRRDIYPELIVEAIPLELRVKNIFIGAAKLVLPKNKFVKMMRQRTLASRYELTLAMITANNHIKSEIGKMPELYGRNSSLVRECQEFYKKRAQIALIQRRKQERMEGALELQYHTVRNAALSAEYEAIDDLTEHGKIPDTVAAMLKEELENRKPC